MWGAAAHALIPLAQRQGEPYNAHADLKRVAQRLRTEYGEEIFRDGFEAAEKFHIHFYHAQMGAVEFANRLSVARSFVNRLLDLAS